MSRYLTSSPSHPTMAPSSRSGVTASGTSPGSTNSTPTTTGTTAGNPTRSGTGGPARPRIWPRTCAQNWAPEPGSSSSCGAQAADQVPLRAGRSSDRPDPSPRTTSRAIPCCAGSAPPEPARPAKTTPGLAGLNVVRPRAARCGRSTLPPAAAPALTGTYPGKASSPRPPAWAGQLTSSCQLPPGHAGTVGRRDVADDAPRVPGQPGLPEYQDSTATARSHRAGPIAGGTDHPRTRATAAVHPPPALATSDHAPGRPGWHGHEVIGPEAATPAAGRSRHA